MIETKNLTRRFYTGKALIRGRAERFSACENVSISIAEGEIFGLVGESGCGKTTLANMLLMLLKPCEGEIRIDGEDVTNISGRKNLASIRRKIQYVPQNSGSSLNPHMTLERIITEPMRNFGINHKNEAERLLEIVGLPSRWKSRRPAQLSGGQRQRVAIARAISINPKALVLDEVTSNLDVITSVGILGTLEEINKQFNTSMMMITHDISQADRFCHRKGVMRDGKIIEITNDLTHAQHDYTKQLVNSALSFKLERNFSFA